MRSEYQLHSFETRPVTQENPLVSALTKYVLLPLWLIGVSYHICTMLQKHLIQPARDIRRARYFFYFFQEKKA